MPTVIAIAIGATCGALSRYYLAAFIMRAVVGTSSFPWGTLCVNILGCFAMGLIVEAMSTKLAINQDMRALLIIGFLGSFTTMSAFAMDFAMLMDRGAYLYAGSYLASSTLLSIGALFLGMFLIKVATA